MFFFGYKMEVFFFQSNPKNQDPSFNTVLDFLFVLKGKLNFTRSVYIFAIILEGYAPVL